MPRLLAAALLALGAPLATGCGSAAYLAHVSLGQVRLLLDREPLDAAARERLSPAERIGLAALERALAKAAELGLATSGSYRHLVDREGNGLVSVVVAARPDRLEPITWWFPIVGRVPYRGYFDPARAERFASDLAARETDVYVRPALLYSTLGWFDDPVPRSLLRLDPVDVMDVILHERVHETIFAPDDTAYNEALATLVAERATLELLAAEPATLERARRSFADRRRFAALLETLAVELEGLYAGIEGPQAAREARAPVFRRFQEQEFRAAAWETQRYAGFPELELSNAYLVAQRTYLRELPCFERELAALGGDLHAFLRRHAEQPGRRPACD